RLDVDGGSPYAVPSDNPFVGTAGASPEIWVYGLRNPWRFSFDRANGDLYIGDVGQSRLEEISVQDAGSGGGENFGWNVMEGTDCFGAASCNTSGLTLPVYEYDHDEGCSVTGGYVYRGAALTELAGRYFFGDFCSGFVRSFRYQAGAAVDVQDHGVDLGTIGGLSSFGEDSAGELYLLDIEGVVYRLVASD
ncbi:MAG: PQQ-dependent sugar dehydrogenase, partial [Gemmatimonadetes bacterium]|nr:PQQ-dependent sugar dehydrogenase [Gemmatimonadota bacterium]